MFKIQNLDYKIVFMVFCISHLFTLCEVRPLRKRTVSEVQLMHNHREHKQAQGRRDWLQMRLQDIHTAPGGNGSGSGSGSGEAGGTGRKLRPSDLTAEEIQYAIELLEKVLKSKQSLS